VVSNVRVYAAARINFVPGPSNITPARDYYATVIEQITESITVFWKILSKVANQKLLKQCDIDMV
jgi:hypothetical protein